MEMQAKAQMLKLRQVDADEFRQQAHAWGLCGLFLVEAPPEVLPVRLMPYIQEGVYHIARYRGWTGELYPYRNYLYRLSCPAQPLGYKEFAQIKNDCYANLFLYRVDQFLLVVAQVLRNPSGRSEVPNYVWLETLDSIPPNMLPVSAPIPEELATVLARMLSAQIELCPHKEPVGTIRCLVRWDDRTIDLNAYLKEWLLEQAKQGEGTPMEAMTDCVWAFHYWVKMAGNNAVLTASLLRRFRDALELLLGEDENPYPIFVRFLRWVAYRANLPPAVLEGESSHEPY